MKRELRYFYILISVLFIATLISGCSSGPSPDDPRLQPKIRTMSKQKMIVAEMKGDPAKNGKIAYPALFEIYSAMKGKIEGLENSIFRARYPVPPGTPRNEIIGIYGLAVPEAVETIPELPGWKKNQEVDVRIEDWEYGEVGEILHVGPYVEMAKAVEKLISYIQKEGYEISGPREEEYIKYEGMAAPKDYETIIRFRVTKNS